MNSENTRDSKRIRSKSLEQSMRKTIISNSISISKKKYSSLKPDKLAINIISKNPVGSKRSRKRKDKKDLPN